jgi:hypothetical protein
MLCSRLVKRADELMDCPASARSITYEGIMEIVRFMAPADGDASFTSREMQQMCQGKTVCGGKTEQFHPMHRFEALYVMRPPDFAVTYVWGMDFRKQFPLYIQSVKRYVKSSGFVHDDIKRNFEEMTFWIDIFFVDQNLSNIIDKLINDCSRVYAQSPHHVIFMSDYILDRGWCLVEICYRAFALQKEYTLSETNLTNLMAGYVNSITTAHSSTVSLRQNQTETFISENKLPSLHFITDIAGAIEKYSHHESDSLNNMHVFNNDERGLIKNIVTTLFDEETFNKIVRAFARRAVAQLKKLYPPTTGSR